MPREYINFTYLSSNTTPAITSTGLGRAIDKDLVERYEGRFRVSVLSVGGEGTTFTVMLPMAK